MGCGFRRQHTHAELALNTRRDLDSTLAALADPVRVKLVSLLFSAEAGEVCGCDLAAAVGLAESTISHHLSQLRRAGMVESERRGMNVYHRPRRDSLVALCTVLDPNCCR